MPDNEYSGSESNIPSMVKLNDYYHDTLMHESGQLLQEDLAEQRKPLKQTRYIVPGGLVNKSALLLSSSIK